jgi:hypothetical protein
MHARSIPAVLSDQQLEAAIAALSDPQRFAGAERRLAKVAPQLQRVLNHALNEGGWFGEAHESEVRKAARAPDEAERARLMKVLLAEETRMGMLVGVAVGWELAREIGVEQEEEGV